MKFLSKTYTNPNTNPKTLTAGILTLNNRHGAFESFCAPVFCDFIRNYFLSDSETFGLLDTSVFVRRPTHWAQRSAVLSTGHGLGVERRWTRRTKETQGWTATIFYDSIRQGGNSSTEIFTEIRKWLGTVNLI